jgi:hypothetical protein
VVSSGNLSRLAAFKTATGSFKLTAFVCIEPQEVISEIGPPVSVFRKSEDPNDGYIRLLAPSELRLLRGSCLTAVWRAPGLLCSTSVAGGVVGEYFHNYPQLGLDILYDSLHRAAKVILKTNALGCGISLYPCC